MHKKSIYFNKTQAVYTTLFLWLFEQFPILEKIIRIIGVDIL